MLSLVKIITRDNFMWSITCLDNTVIVNKEIAKELFENANSDYWYDLEEVIYDEKLTFNSDHNEHMDYISDDRVQNILKKHKVKGMIVFLSADGDNSGSLWAYDFDGNGNLSEKYIDLSKEENYKKVLNKE